MADNTRRAALSGSVQGIRYRNAETRYLVLSVRVEGRADLVVATGHGRDVEVGAAVELQGRWVEHPTYGRQFAFERIAEQLPTAPAAIARRLSLYPGIGSVTAERVVAKFGAQTLSILDSQPRRLLEVKGIGARGLDKILEFHATRSGPLAQLEDRLAELDLSTRLAKTLHDRYGDAALQHLEQDPFRLAREVRGIGFKVADRIARALGLSLDAPTRIDAGIVHCMHELAGRGHTAVESRILGRHAVDLLAVEEDVVADGLARLLQDELLAYEPAHEDELYIFDPLVRDAEVRVAGTLAALALAPCEQWRVPPHPEHLGDSQRSAVEMVARCGFTVLTGGPGTGKSTVVAQVLALAAHNDVEVMMAAPTGRAAKRLEQATGVAAKTLHRLLEVQPESGGFGRGESDPLPPGLVVVDETSMLDIQMAAALIDALTPAHRVLWVGDADQLPSVGPGQVLRDVIEAAALPESPLAVVRLDTVYRQDASSSIVTNAHRMLHGESLVPDPPQSRGSFFVLRSSDEHKTRAQVIEMATERIPEAFGLKFPDDVQVLAPMRRGAVGTEGLNTALQAFHTADRPGIDSGDRARGTFREGDRVLQLKNDYERGVFNGDVGEVISVAPRGRALTVDFGDAVASYESKDLRALGLAYAMTIHKSQGSEFPAVVIPLVRSHSLMLRRNLIYTAVTRAKRLCVVAGDGRAIERAIRSAQRDERSTTLTRRLGATFHAQLGTLVVEPSVE